MKMGKKQEQVKKLRVTTYACGSLSSPQGDSEVRMALQSCPYWPGFYDSVTTGGELCWKGPGLERALWLRQVSKGQTQEAVLIVFPAAGPVRPSVTGSPHTP